MQINIEALVRQIIDTIIKDISSRSGGDFIDLMEQDVFDNEFYPELCKLVEQELIKYNIQEKDGSPN